MQVFSSIFLILIIALATSDLLGQVNDQKIRQKVLEKGVVDSQFVFGKWSEKGGTETHLNYLGQLTTKNGRTFRIVISSWFWGLSHRATSRILIFDKKNQYLGEYSVSAPFDLPTKLKNGNLIFTNTGDHCDKRLFTVVNLKNGLPKKFFRKCKGELGDIYTFYSD